MFPVPTGGWKAQKQDRAGCWQVQGLGGTCLRVTASLQASAHLPVFVLSFRIFLIIKVTYLS